MDEHKTPEEMNTEETVQPEAAVEETVTDTPSAAEACAQPEEVTAGEPAAAEADAGEVPVGEADVDDLAVLIEHDVHARQQREHIGLFAQLFGSEFFHSVLLLCRKICGQENRGVL